MSINYSERLEYRLREVLIKIKRANKWIKDNPSEKNANMDEIINYLFEVGWILNDLKNYIISTKTNYMTSEISELIEEMKFMLKERNDSIRTFTDAVGITDLWNDFVSNVFSGNINFYSTFENLKIKELVCKEIGVLKYIYEVRRNNFNYLFDNESELEYMRDLLEQTTHCPEIGKKLIELIEGYYYKEPLKGSNDIFEVQSEKIVPVEGENLVDNNKSNSLKDKIILYYDLDNGDIYTSFATFGRFKKNALGGLVIIDGKRCLKMSMQDAKEIDNNKNNDYSPYDLEVRNVHLGNRKNYQTEAVNEVQDKEDGLNSESSISDKIVLYRDLDNDGLTYVKKSVLTRFGIINYGQPVIINGSYCYQIGDTDINKIIRNQNNEYSPYLIEEEYVNLGKDPNYQRVIQKDEPKYEDNKNKALNNKLKSKEEIYYFDDIVFSSPEEELEFAEEVTKKFSIWDCFINHKRCNATIFLDANNEFCLHPIKTHLFSAMKLYRALHNSDIDMDTDESALGFNNNQGNVIFRIVNESSEKFFVPYFPTNINEFQLEKLKKYYQDFFEVYSYLTINNLLDDDQKFEKGLEALEQYINKYDSDNNMHHTM